MNDKENIQSLSTSNQNSYENSLQLLIGKMEMEMKEIKESNDTYYNLLSQKEELSYQILEDDSSLFQSKRELENLFIKLTEKKKEIEILSKGLKGYDNQKLKDILFDSPTEVFESNLKEGNSLNINLSNGIQINIDTKALKLSKILALKEDNAKQAENLNKIIKEDPDTAMLYCAFQI